MGLGICEECGVNGGHAWHCKKVKRDASKSASVTGYKPTEEYIYAKRLAKHLWENHYKKKVPEWEPLPDLMGILSQIDNMIAGL